MRTTVPLTALVLAAACADRVPTAPVDPISAARVPVAVVTPRFWVGLKDGATGLPASALAAAGASARVVDSIPNLHVLVVAGATNPSALQTDGVVAIEQEFTTQLNDQVMASNDVSADAASAATPWYQSGVQWDMRAMHADFGWANTTQGSGVNVCIVDTGVDQGHQELAGRVAVRTNFVTDTAASEQTVEDLAGHGSHVAGTIGAGGVVINGVAPQVTIMSARVLNAAGSGSGTAIVNGIMWCADHGAHVINMSLGGRIYGSAAYVNSVVPQIVSFYGQAINYATSRGTAVIVAAGNDNLQLPNPGGLQFTYPAQIQGVLSIGATGPVTKSSYASIATGFNPFDGTKVWQSPDGRAFYSNYGTGVNVFAPGGFGSLPFSVPYYRYGGVTQGSSLDNVYSLCAGTTAQTGAINVGGAPGSAGTCSGATNRYIAYAGTSMATPHVAGLAALLYAELGGVRSAANVTRILGCIKSTADNIGPSSTFGNGRVNEQSAITAIRAGSC